MFSLLSLIVRWHHVIGLFFSPIFFLHSSWVAKRAWSKRRELDQSGFIMTVVVKVCTISTSRHVATCYQTCNLSAAPLTLCNTSCLQSVLFICISFSIYSQVQCVLKQIRQDRKSINCRSIISCNKQGLNPIKIYWGESGAHIILQCNAGLKN